MVEGGPYFFAGIEACVNSLVTSARPFDLYKVSLGAPIKTGEVS